MAAFNGAYRRRVRTVSPEIVRRVGERLKEYAPWQIVATPILSAAPRRAAGRVDPNDLDSTRDDDEAFRKQVMPEWCLRDGKHPRVGPDGKTYGATHWIERELQRADRTELTPRLTKLARELGIADELVKIGVKLLEDEG